MVGAEKVVFSVVIWTAFGFAEASQATALDDDVNACCVTLAAAPKVDTPLTSQVPFMSIAVAVKSISFPPAILNIEPLPLICSPPASLRYSLPVLAINKSVPSKVKFASPIIALAPVTVVIVLLVDPDKLVPAPSAPE